MYYPQIQDNGNSRQLIDSFLGYNHNYRVGLGEFYDMNNLSSDFFPVLSPRKIRPVVAEVLEDDYIRGIVFTDNDLTYLEGTTLHYGTQEIDLSDYLDEPNGEDYQKLLRFGAYILIWPALVYVNLYDQTDVGHIDAKYTTEVGTTITYTICDSTGAEFDNITASDTAPENPSDGDYWLCTATGMQGLNIYRGSLSSWEPVATSYIRIDIPGATLTSLFKEGDTVNMNSFLLDINNGSQIKAMTDTSIVVIGLIPNAVQYTETTTEAWKFYVERKIPHLDQICCDKNRVWGCHYGYVNGEMVNEIYASKLGDFKNWYTYQGLSTDSYAASVGVPGQWTGCISYQGHPTFFKENAIFKVYGSYPSEYQVTQDDCRGVQFGSSRSLAIVDEYLVYKSSSDICVYDGSSPVSISDQLGREEMYYDAVAGGCLNKYRVVMENAKGKKFYFVYDFRYGIWEKESADSFKEFTATENGQVYAATGKKIYGLGSHDNIVFSQDLVSEEWVEWDATTGEMGFEYPDYKYVSRFTLRAFVPFRSELKISISYDDRPFEDLGVLRGADDIGSQSIAFNPFRCDHFRIRLSGHGDCRVYSLAFTLDTGSEEDGY